MNVNIYINVHKITTPLCIQLQCVNFHICTLANKKVQIYPAYVPYTNTVCVTFCLFHFHLSKYTTLIIMYFHNKAGL